MKAANKLYLLPFFLFVFLIFAHFVAAQNAEISCFEIKYLDFFGLDNKTKLHWTDEEIDKLLAADYSQNTNNTNFLIPFIVFQLKDLHPNCVKSIDEKRIDTLVGLYSKIRGESLVVPQESIAKKLSSIRQDFYSLVQDAKNLPLMKYTMDDGPLYGETLKTLPRSKSRSSLVTDSGKLSIVESNGRVYLLSSNRRNKPMWSCLMTGRSPDRYLRNLEFDKNPIEVNSLATIITFHSEGERLTLFLRHDGRFMYYYHSW